MARKFQNVSNNFRRDSITSDIEKLSIDSHFIFVVGKLSIHVYWFNGVNSIARYLLVSMNSGFSKETCRIFRFISYCATNTVQQRFSSIVLHAYNCPQVIRWLTFPTVQICAQSDGFGSDELGTRTAGLSEDDLEGSYYE